MDIFEMKLLIMKLINLNKNKNKNKISYNIVKKID
jgi:hypothetical protein